ncbi:MAG: putative ABC transporter permease [Clostridia bacterium]|nr:putative ABC transporter permease [Clostridia bacterium]
MSMFLKLAFLFFMGSIAGWVIELFFRKFFSDSNPEKKWINPGFCTGPYLPLYGVGLCAMYLIASLENYDLITNPFWNKIALFAFMALCMTGLEYIAGIISLKIFKVRLWDYSNNKGNIQGIICPLFSFFWAVLGAIYYFLIHPHILDAIIWLSENLAFSFVVGMFFGVFIIDVVHSGQLVAKFKKFAEEYEVVVRHEQVKSRIRARYNDNPKKYRFFRPFKSDKSLLEHLKEMSNEFEEKKKKNKK